MKTMTTKGFITLLMIILFTAQAFNQENRKRTGLELNGGISIATNKLEGTRLNAGFGFEGIFHYRLLPHAGIYAGWGWNRFEARHSFAGNDICFEETGYIAGIEYSHSIGASPVACYLRAGGLFNHIETENAAGDIINDSGHGPGWQVAAGLEVPVGTKWTLTPGVKFNSLSRATDFEGVTRNLNQNYVSARIGILRSF